MNDATQSFRCYAREGKMSLLRKWQKCELSINKNVLTVSSKGKVIVEEPISTILIAEGSVSPMHFSQMTLTNAQGKVWHVLPGSPLFTGFLGYSLLQASLIKKRSLIAQALLAAGAKQHLAE